MQQLFVVRDELILAVRHIDGSQFQVVQLVLVDEPFQGKGVPHNLSLFLVIDLLEDGLHILAGNSVFLPSFAVHQLLTETILPNHHLVVGEVFETVYHIFFIIRTGHTLREQRDDSTTVGTLNLLTVFYQSEHQVRLLVAHIGKRLLTGFQLDDIGDIELVEEHFDQVDVKTVGFSFIVDKSIGPQVAGILVN